MSDPKPKTKAPTDAALIADAAKRSEQIANAIREIQGATRALLQAGLTRRALVVLIQDRTVGIGKKEIGIILTALEDLGHFVEPTAQEAPDDE
ncbi:MAG: hypothetical protein HKN04_11925 [Rhodothermaceae bacterium]|nr:hypothetical protein [Rhodothermaceae bacterium]